ncbi:hypothetical protein ACQPZQ_13205 [Pseudonocardia sp. CA-142604]|uniref:hypothetical protein n=1 Tax=Pseudonocardia sp. CA-142604 TaxID=3240024 RepID=UPI003D8C010F
MHLVPPDPRLTGHWRRSLLATPDGRRDTTTRVSWLQAGELYVDLRIPAAGPELRGARRLGDLDRGRAIAVARIEGFAGRLVADGGWARWERLVDIQPPTASPDEGRLAAEHGGAVDTMVETGRDGSYVEHWQRVGGPGGAPVAVLLSEATTGACAVLVRVGEDIGWARGRARPLPPGRRLADLVAAAATTEGARDLLDTEVAIGRLGRDGAVLTRSSLPWRAGAPFRVSVHDGGLATEDVDAAGEPVRHVWHVLAREGAPAGLPLSRPSGESRR